jgi:pimeloyl-ACP methyl ester carboxylesterase
MVGSQLLQTSASTTSHPDEVWAVHRRILDKSPARARHIEVGAGRQVHVIEAGDGPPVVLLHGSGTSSLLLLPLLERLDGVWGIAVDRPGFGLSDPADLPRQHLREAVVEWIDDLLDRLGVDQTALAGNSMGGLWALWYALARPDRVRQLVLLAAAPLLPGTRVPPPLRLMATPGLGDLMNRLTRPSPKMVVQMMASMGEQDTIVNFPDQIEAMVAAGRDPVASAASLAELRVAISPFGFRPALRLQPAELRKVRVPTLLIWGDHEPLGGVKIAEMTAELIPSAQLEMLPAGHAPWLGNLDRTAELVFKFVS